MEKQLNVDFSNIRHQFAENSLSIRIDKDKRKSILFTSEFKKKNTWKIIIKYGGIQIKKHSKIKDLACLMDETMSV